MTKKINIYYNRTNTCDNIIAIGFSWRRCGEKLVPRKAIREKNKNGNLTGRWICNKCYLKDYHKRPDSQVNIQKSLANRRIGNLDPNSEQAKGDKSQELACELYGWEDLNKKYDNYNTPIDCYDPRTGLYHQVQGSYYNYIEKYWFFGNFEREWEKIFEYMICFCFNKYGKIVERIYKFPKEEIERVKGITIFRNPTVGRYSTPFTPWYEKYRITNEDELKKANEIWREIL